MYYITNIYALKTLADDISNTTTDVRDVIDKLHDIARGRTPRANTRDRIAATRILLDRGFGKVPRRADYNPDRHQTPVPDDDGPVGPSHSPTPTTPGTVAQLDESLHDSLGPAPSFEPDPAPSLEPDPQSTTDSHIVDVIDTQDYILMVTDNGHTLVTVLTDILRADDDDPAVRPSHQIAVARILLDRTLGSDCEPPKDSVPPEDVPYTQEWLEDGYRQLNEITLRVMASPSKYTHLTAEERENRLGEIYKELKARHAGPGYTGYTGRLDDYDP
jgi:hypothetical protein